MAVYRNDMNVVSIYDLKDVSIEGLKSFSIDGLKTVSVADIRANMKAVSIVSKYELKGL